ncbi:FKBP-type peptidyl-prolyl cis-trans isomerase [Lishizhenia tianjinensis]|uniref:Peptidyl-prolyl cis-trans isomerase n=1 Tax=Lishizhenia tianjinensis TaxID=477690 RepID=A0A1I6XCM0_9FLAO|nr:FKBP-type peptidyl-prolyl cis-trans isomerase [Lishizhenia tianjinensis]SFT35564.1 FKBP-type peptidyl-prolyl cis-trans isomerase [Lishizhenia tianjinensis]
MKLNNALVPFFALPFFYACSIDGVKDVDSNTPFNTVDSAAMNAEDSLSSVKMDSADTLEIVQKDTVSELALDNGIKITWFKKGKGPKVELYDVLRIDYKNALEDGKVYDGNHLIKKTSIAYPYGWNIQTEGWKIALQYLSVGDEVDIFLPAKLARGERGIPGLVPPNADNYLHLSILDKIAPVANVDGIKVYTIEESKEENEAVVTDKSKIKVHYFAHSASQPRYANTYADVKPIYIDMANTTELPALVKALKERKNHDKVYVHIPAAQAYGEQGLEGKVKPNEDIMYDLIILDVKN